MPTGRPQRRRVAILIAGVHRSGTSALARVVGLLGGALPRTLAPANAANEKGYWESPLVNRLNNELLALGGADWKGWQRLRARWSEQPGVRSLKRQAREILESEFGSAKLLVLKDPRLCRLIGFWREVLEGFGARPVAVCPLRNPLEVAASLEKRNGLAPAVSHLIWLRYVLDAELGTRGMPRAFVSYDALLTAWRPAVDRLGAELGIAWPRSPAQAAGEIEAFLSPADRHHVVPAEKALEDPGLPESLRTAYAIVDRWAKERERRADFKPLDRIRRELDDISPAVLPLIAAGHERTEEARKLKKATARLDAEASAGAAQLAEVKARLAETERHLAQRDAEAHTNEAQLLELRSQFAQAARRLAQKDAEAIAGAAQLAQARTQLADTARRLAESEAQAGASAAQLAQVTSQLAEASRLVAQRDADAEARTHELQEIRSRLAETALQLSRRYAETHAYSEQLKALRAELVLTAGNLAKREVEAEARNVQLAGATAASEKLRSKLNSERQGRVTLQAAFDRLQADLSRAQRHRDEARKEMKRLAAELRRVHSSPAWKVVQAADAAVRGADAVLRWLRIVSSDPAKKMARVIAGSQLFDRDWYLKQYPDVVRQGVNPALHYVRHGASEGRDPGPGFSTRWYLGTYKDVAAEGINPLLHYLLHGKAEGREIAPSSAVAPAPAGAAEPAAAPVAAPVPAEPAVAAAEPLSMPSAQAAEAAWTRHAEIVRKDADLSIEMSGLIVATVPAGGGAGESAWTGIADAARAIVVFCRLMGMEPRQALSCRIGDATLDVAASLGALTDPAACPVISFASGAAPAELVDAWYVNDRDMRLRFSTRPAADAQACVARFFQHDFSSAGLSLAGESLLAGQGVRFADVALTNAFLPVLMILATPEGHLLSASLLPFPSLCRGGVHYGELCASGEKAGYLENLHAVSGTLLGEILGSAADFSVARIEIDLQDALGSERIFSSETREWLAGVAQIGVVPANAAAVGRPKVRAYLEASLASVPLAQRPEIAERIAARERAGAVAVTLPADGVPSLHALVARGRRLGSGSARTVGSFVVADSATVSPRWAISVPPMGEELLMLQPVGAGVYPVVTGLTAQAAGSQAGNPLAMPLAVRFRDTRERHPASLIMPVAPDAPGPLLRRAAVGTGSEPRTISVLLASGNQGKEVFGAVLEALKSQTLVESVDIIAVVNTAQAEARSAAEGALQRVFPGRYRLLEQDGGASRNASINRAAEQAAGRFLVVAGGDVALHDPRTLETLCAIADHDRVASAGCVLLQAGGERQPQAAVFRSGGIFPSGISQTGAHETAFSEPDCLDVFPAATYPVAANSSALFMVRSDVWRALGGFGSGDAADVHGDIEYGLRAIAGGFVHLCTSVVSAELYAGGFRGRYAEEVLAAAPAGDVAASATLVEALRA